MNGIVRKPWSLNGNDGIDPDTQFLGTNDATDFCIKTNGVELLRFKSDGMIAFGGMTPEAGIHARSMFNNKPALRVDANPAGFVNIFEVRTQSGKVGFACGPDAAPYSEDPNLPFQGTTRFGQYTTSAFQSTVFGYLTSAFNGSGASAFGNSATAEATLANAFGQDCEVDGFASCGMGAGIRIDHSNCFGFGRSAKSTANNQVIFGSSNSPYTDFYFGEGVESSTPQDISFNAMNAEGADIGAGFNWDINAPRGTGTGIGGHLRFRTAKAGAAGSTWNNLKTMLEITDDEKIGFFNTLPAVQQVVTGSRDGNAAIASLLTGLANLGLIVDNTTA